jgi:lipopolysaccharide transport system ATP-binding protein
MHEPAIQVSSISKRYCRSLKKSLWYGVRDIGKELSGRGQEADRLRPAEFWALRDVSFDVGRGESIGLVGHNGAGKTTLLKLINGLVKPSSGMITVRGSVRALIALGAGFNPVLTGRENIRVASAVLGFSEQETREQFDAIVEFSELEDVIDAPVQTYSTGMAARLGFSIAVNTRPEVLLVDEVLAVGDVSFVLKCFQRIADFRADGGAILLVSHNPYNIRTHCDRAVWLEQGKVREIGDANEVCDRYELFMSQGATPAPQRHGDGSVRLISIEVPPAVESGDELPIRLIFESDRPIVDPIVQLGIASTTGQHIAVNDSLTDGVEVELPGGASTVELTYPSLPLRPGVYSIDVAVAERVRANLLLVDVSCATIEVKRKAHDHGVGVLNLEPSWTAESGDSSRSGNRSTRAAS